MDTEKPSVKRVEMGAYALAKDQGSTGQHAS
jgi:hypothetical protein